MIRIALSARLCRMLLPGLTGLALGCLPGAGLLLWSGRPTLPSLRSAGAHGPAIPAAYSIKPSLWEIPNG